MSVRRAITILLVIVAGIAGAAAVWIVPKQNQLARLHENVKREWIQLDQVLQRRYDGVPGLVRAERSAAGHDETVVGSLERAAAALRTASGVNERIAASCRVEEALVPALELGKGHQYVRRSPELGALIVALEATDAQLADSRMRFNAAVSELKATLRSIGASLANRMAGVPAFEYYDPHALAVPPVLPPEPVPVPEAAPEPPPVPHLAGVLREKGRKRLTALIGWSNGETTSARVGDTVKDLGRVREIDEDSVIFDGPSGSPVIIGRQ